MKKQIDSVGRPEIIVNQEAYRDQEYEGIPLINRRKTRAPYETIETYDNGEKVILRNAMTDETNPLDDVGMHHFLEEVEIEKVKEKKGDKKGDKKAPPVKEKETTIKLKRKQIKEGYEESGVDIETYNKYTGGSSDKTVDEVIVGVAGSDSPVMIDTDWYQNLSPSRGVDTVTLYPNPNIPKNPKIYEVPDSNNFSMYQSMTMKELEQLATEDKLGFDASKRRYALYELQMRRASTTLAEVHKTGIPITIQGDSKGGEDSAYLTLKTVSNIKKEEKKEIKDMNIHLSVINPKQVRFNKESKKMLEELAKENKITVEKVYPEVLSKGIFSNQEGFDIPAGTMIITVPNERSLITNHKVGAYDSNVLSGVNGEYSFHNVETVYGDMEKAKKLYPKMKTQFIEGKKVAAVYEYTINQVRHKSGIVMSVSDYFFIEQQEQLSVISDSLSTCAEKVGGYIENAVLRNPGVLSYGGQTLGVLQTENILESYRKVSDASKESLKSIQEEYITSYDNRAAYYTKYASRAREEYLETGMKEKYIQPEDIRSLLSIQFDEEAREHVEHKSQFYTEKIIKKVTPSIKSYEKKVDNLKEIVLSHQNELIEVSESIELQRRELETATGEAKDKIQMKITRIINIQNKG